MRNAYRVREDGAVEIDLPGGLKTLMDEEDLPLVSSFAGTWRAGKFGEKTYACIEVRDGPHPQTVLTHELIVESARERRRGEWQPIVTPNFRYWALRT